MTQWNILAKEMRAPPQIHLHHPLSKTPPLFSFRLVSSPFRPNMINPNRNSRRKMNDPTFMTAQVVRVSERIVPVNECVAGGKDCGDQENSVLVVVSFYKFADFPDHVDLRKPLKRLCQDLV